MSHAPAAYDGMCINCGMTPNQQIGYAHCSTGRQDVSYDDWYYRHVTCDRCGEQTKYISALGEAGPHVCDSCGDRLLEADEVAVSE